MKRGGNYGQQNQQNQQHYSNQRMSMGVQQSGSANIYASWSLRLGIFSMLGQVCCGLGGIIGVIGLIFGIVAVKDKQCNKMVNAVFGIVLSAISMLITASLLSIFGSYVLKSNNAVDSEQISEETTVDMSETVRLDDIVNNNNSGETTETQESTIEETTETIADIGETVKLNDIIHNATDETSEEHEKLERKKEVSELLDRCIVDEDGVLHIAVSDIEYAYNNEEDFLDLIGNLENNTVCIEDTLSNVRTYSYKSYTYVVPCLEYINGMEITTSSGFIINTNRDEIADSKRLVEDHLVYEYDYMYDGLSAYMLDVIFIDTTDYIWAKENIASGLLTDGATLRIYGSLNYDEGWLVTTKEINECYKIEILDNDKNVVSTWECTEINKCKAENMTK